jgi:exopolyphosphatase/guanosine-5'-triphosphate,3'-diphosphate pyrophosphatase
MPRRVAAIDIGTNSVLLTIAEDAAGGPRAVLERATITRLGQGVDRSGRLADEAVDRTLACLEQYARAIVQSGVDAVDVVGTSAMRDAANSDVFVSRATAALGVTPRVVSGVEEAELTFSGALSGLQVMGSVTVFDVGGGSTEVIGAPAVSGAEGLTGVSLDVGSVRLHERHVRTDPASADELRAVRRDVQDALARAPRPGSGSTLVGVAGTVTTLAAIEQSLATYDSAKVHGARLSSASVAELATRLGGLPLKERRQLPGLEPARADVIVVGAAIVDEVVAWSGASQLVVSDRGVRWGLIQRLLAAG